MPRQGHVPQQEPQLQNDRRDAFLEEFHQGYRDNYDQGYADNQDRRFRDNDGRGYRDGYNQGYRNNYNRDYRENYDPGYREYQGYQRRMPSPPMGYRAPADYYGLPPVRGFVYPQQPLPQQAPRFQRQYGSRWQYGGRW